MNVTVLVDFDNDSVSTALAVAEELGDRLWGVRLDTSGTLVDRSILDEMESEADFDPTGVNVRLAEIVRAALDDGGHPRVKIVASGGFDAAKIRGFEQARAPVDVCGVDSALVRGENDFTADVVLVEGRPGGKRGRPYRPNPRLEPVL
jgi:nicotinate phosphoribosyltransferase